MRIAIGEGWPSVDGLTSGAAVTVSSTIVGGGGGGRELHPASTAVIPPRITLPTSFLSTFEPPCPDNYPTYAPVPPEELLLIPLGSDRPPRRRHRARTLPPAALPRRHT